MVASGLPTSNMGKTPTSERVPTVAVSGEFRQIIDTLRFSSRVAKRIWEGGSTLRRQSETMANTSSPH